MLDSQTFSIISSILLALLGLVAYRLFSYNHPLPPGPPGKLISGNLHQLPKNESWRTYAKWAETYGPVIYLRAFHKRFVILNSAKAAVDLLETRSSIYSDRPVVWMVSEGLAARHSAIFNISSLNPRFKQCRKQLNSGLGGSATRGHIPLIEQESQTFLTALATTPEKFISHTRRNAGAVILKITYGWTVISNDDPLVLFMEEGLHIGAEITQPGRWLVEILPLLRFVPAWMPGAGFKRRAAWMRERMSNIDLFPFNWAKEQIKSGDYIESFTSMGLQPEGGKLPNPEEEDILKWCSAALYAGGSDTTVSVMTTFFLMMTLHPDVQRRAQAEIDRVVGKDRLPSIDDQKALPFTMAVIKEVLRCAPVVPAGLPHRVTQENIYQGFRIPKGTTVVANIWAITRDSDMYPNPSVFDPERFVPRPGFEVQTDPRKWVFGFGRRVCPGAHFAETTVFVNIAGILATFNISKAVKDGKEVEPEIGFKSHGIISHPKPFDCRITPRSPDLLASLSVA
ncbi:hypothetical protein PILCRDRAFT_8150 [Piloderma croceum F 1598]|uniref:Cytochrome P450 n=1 Tax=Piloderma croceum (strain F 1598) TaxID=765440 RepID=A0A0C3FCJ4_PILCF|nr:hypothetical protein PILCRDRAFT_8150 [Piloderma croceum F 1598]